MAQSKKSGNRIAEVAVYTVKDPDSYPGIIGDAMKRIVTMPGILGGVQLRSIKDPALYADVFLWTDLAPAKEAAQRVERDEEFAEFRNSFDDMRLFTHYRTEGDLQDLFAWGKGDTAVEIAAFTVKDTAIRERYQPIVYDRLRASGSVRSAIAMSPLAVEDGSVDMIGWISGAAAEQVAGELMQDAETKPFFENAGEMRVFDMFTVYEQQGLE